MLHYYLSQSQDIQEANAKKQCLKEEIFPFRQYLFNSIEALKKTEVEASFERVESDSSITPSLKGFMYEYRPQMQIVFGGEGNFFDDYHHYLFLKNIPKNPDYNEKLIFTLSNDEKIKIPIKKQDFKSHVDFFISTDSHKENVASSGFLKLNNEDFMQCKEAKKLSWDGENVEFMCFEDWLKEGEIKLDEQGILIKDFKNNQFILESNHLQTATIISKDGFNLPFVCKESTLDCKFKTVQEEENHTIIYTEGKIEHAACTLIDRKHYINYLDVQSLKVDDQPIHITKDESGYHLLDEINMEDSFEARDKNDLIWKLGYNQKSSKYPIRLIARNEAEDEIESPLRYFLDSDKEIKVQTGSDKPISCKAKVIDREEYIISLLHKGKPYLPKPESTLKIEPNTYQLECQKNAIEALINHPIKEQHTLIKLFQSRKKMISHGI